MASLVNDSVYVDLANSFFANFGHYSAKARCSEQDLHLFSNILYHAAGVALGILCNMLINQTQILTGWR